MGYDLAERALIWSRVCTPRETLTLVAMALHAMDPDVRPMYYGGREWLALATLGRPLLPDSPTYKADGEAVRRSVAGLIKVGAIQRAQGAVNGGRAIYELTINSLPLVDKSVRNPVDNTESTEVQPLKNRGAEPLKNRGAEPLKNRGAEPLKNPGPI